MSVSPDEVRLWTRYAAQDYETARKMIDVEGVPARQICVLCQQSAEKYLRAVLIWLGKRVPRTHGLVELRALSALDLADDVSDCALEEVTCWIVAGRYPADWCEPSQDDVALALHTAGRIAYAVEALFAGQENA